MTSLHRLQSGLPVLQAIILNDCGSAKSHHRNLTSPRSHDHFSLKLLSHLSLLIQQSLEGSESVED